MVQNLPPLSLGQGLLHECRQEIGIGMRQLPIVDCRLPIVLIANRLSFQPLEHDFGQSMHIVNPDDLGAVLRRHDHNRFPAAVAA
jgi:hypothetical protein